MTYRTIQLPDANDFLACTFATTVLEPDVRVLRRVAELIIANGYAWCQANRDRNKKESWWDTVQRIEEGFDWSELLKGDPVTANVWNGSLEFGSIGGFGGGCHRTIALSVRVLKDTTFYRPFGIKLACG
jgi:hypothetical protein